MKKLFFIMLLVMIMAGCANMVKDEGKWEASKLFVMTPKVNPDKSVEWLYWQLEVNTSTMLLRPMTVSAPAIRKESQKATGVMKSDPAKKDAVNPKQKDVKK